MLWLNAMGIQQILDGQEAKATKKSPEITEEISSKQNIRLFMVRLFLIFAALILATIFIFNIARRNNLAIFSPLGESLYIAQNKIPLKLAYDFTKNISDTYSVSLDLSGLNLDRYHFLAFQAKIDDAQIISKSQRLTLRVELENSINEKSEYYLVELDSAWSKFLIPLSYFEKITDWASISRIYFGIQPWNTEIKKGTIYIDSIRFLKKTGR